MVHMGRHLSSIMLRSLHADGGLEADLPKWPPIDRRRGGGGIGTSLFDEARSILMSSPKFRLAARGSAPSTVYR